MNLLYVDLDREWRGGQSQALLTLQGLAQNGHEVTLAAAQDSPLATRAANLGIDVQEIPQRGLRFRAVTAIRRLILQNNFDLVHLNEPHAMSAAWLAGAHNHSRLLLSRRIGFPLRKNWFSQSSYRAITRFIANSENVAQSLISSGISANRISVVNEGVELPPRTSSETRNAARAFWNVKSDEFLFGCVSVFVPEKGQRHLIEALAEVRAVHPAARLLLAGDGPSRAELQALAKRLGLTEAVLFPGFVKNVDQIYQALDTFVFPSEFEGLGTALQTAMAYELPSISTARGALGEVVENERTALVAEPNAKEFARAMFRLIGDAELRKQLAVAGRHEVEKRFSAERMVDNTIRVYEDVLRERATR
jgi:glycosyltransferase involved in cell wall biosynthesis